MKRLVVGALALCGALTTVASDAHGVQIPVATAAAAAPLAAASFASPDCAGAPRRAPRNGRLLVRRPHGLDLVAPSGRW